jgi:hypothetical protein
VLEGKIPPALWFNTQLSGPNPVQSIADLPAVSRCYSLSSNPEGRATIARLLAQLAFDGEQAIVLGDALGAAKRSGFDLAPLFDLQEEA